MRILLDTNVLIAAFISHGSCHDIFEHCARNHRMVTSEFILSEVIDNLAFKFKYEERFLKQVADLLDSCMERVVLPPDIPKVCRDRNDDPIIETAISGRCRCLVTGDRDLLVLKNHKGVPIIGPSDFWAYEAGVVDQI